MRVAYSIILAILIVAVCAFSIFLIKKRSATKLHKTVHHLIFSTIFVMVSNLIIALSDNLLMSKIGFVLYFISLDVLIFVFLRTCFMARPNRLTQSLSIVALSIMVIDVGQLVASIFTNYAFEIGWKTAIDGHDYVVTTQFYWPYYLHLTYCYTMVVAAICYLVYLTIKSPKILRPKYYVYFLMILTIVFVNLLYILFNYALDWSVMFYPIFAFVVYYVSVGPIYDSMLRSSMTEVWMNGAILFNEEDRCIYINDFVEEHFGKDLSNYSYQSGLISTWCGGVPLRECDDFSLRYINEPETGKVYFIRFKRIFVKAKYAGSFFCIQDVTEYLKKQEYYHYKATHDEMTGLFNKQEFLIRGEMLLKNQPDESFLICVTDIHNFKLFNEMYGLLAGDNFLRDLANSFTKNRTEKMVYGRLENDHIAALLPRRLFDETLVESSFNEIARRHVPVNSIEFACFMGAYLIPDGESRSDRSLSVYADRALVAASKASNDDDRTIIWYDDHMAGRILFEQSMNNNLSEAINNHDICMYLQPQMNREGKCIGAEALVRWIHPERGIVPPMEFIPYFEKNGRISEIDVYMWEEAIKKIAAWRKENKELYISVNISRYDMYFLDVVGELSKLVKKYDIPNNLLKVEITETVMMSDVEKMSNIVRGLQNEGFVVEMDDFGSAYSSLNSLKDVYIDVLKMDLGFLKKAREQTRARQIIQSVINLAQKLDTEVVFEGVETKAQLEYVHSVGCEVVQGYYYDRPLPIDEFEKKYL